MTLVWRLQLENCEAPSLWFFYTASGCLAGPPATRGTSVSGVDRGARPCRAITTQKRRRDANLWGEVKRGRIVRGEAVPSDYHAKKGTGRRFVVAAEENVDGQLGWSTGRGM